MKKSLKILLIILCLVLLVVVGSLFITNNLNSKRNVLYNLIYYDQVIPGSKYDIKIYDNKIIIVTTHFCSYVNCKPNTEKEKLNFSSENMEKLITFIENNLSEKFINSEGNIEFSRNDLTKDEINIFNSIIENDESYLKNINFEKKLLYTISYDGIDCPTPTLKLYSDNTYEYYYTLSLNEEKITPKTGVYNYDITKIINNIYKYEKSNLGIYYIKEENGKTYTTYDTNNELQELLTSLNIKLEKCLEHK